MRLEGHVDRLQMNKVEGWAIDRDAPGRRVSVDILINDRVVRTMEASEYREDLQAAGVGDGRVCFVFTPADFCQEARLEVRVVFAETKALVPGGAAVLRNGAPEESDGSNPWDRDTAFSYAEIWLGALECQKRINRVISGDETISWLHYVIEKYIVPQGNGGTRAPKSAWQRCLILGANEGHVERTLCGAGFRGKIVATDIAAKALERARARSAALGYRNIEYVVADLNTDSFEGPFDFIIAEGVLHHIGEIEKCLRMVERALAPEGKVIMVEYEGPVRFQLPELQVWWINAMLGVLPKGLLPLEHRTEPAWREKQRMTEAAKRFPATPEEFHSVRYSPPSAEAIRRFDPSEAICGPAFKRLVPELFSIVERKGMGGTLLSYITQHFDFRRSNTDPYAREWLGVLMKIEETVIKTGILDDEFVFYVAAKKKA